MGYWDNHPNERDTLKVKLEVLAPTATSLRELTKGTKETLDVVKYFCRKYDIKTPCIEHGGHNKLKRKSNEPTKNVVEW